MQLNNNKTQEVIQVSRIDTKLNSCVITWYELYTQNVQEVKLQRVHNFTTIDISDYLDSLNNIKEICLNTVKNELELNSDWQISNDNPYNWIYSDKPIRIIVDSLLILEQTKPIDNQGTLSDFGQLIEQQKVDNFDFYLYTINKKYIVLYCNTVDNQDQPVIQPYMEQGRVFVETISTQQN